MEDIKKQEFTYKISRANRTGLTVLIFEIAQEYIKEATQAKDTEQYIQAIRNAGKCVDTLKNSLDFTYTLSATLLHFYVEVKKQMAKAIASLDGSDLAIVQYALAEMHDSFVEVAKQDNSPALYENQEEVSVGYTYGRSGVNVNPERTAGRRGFLA